MKDLIDTLFSWNVDKVKANPELTLRLIRQAAVRLVKADLLLDDANQSLTQVFKAIAKYYSDENQRDTPDPSTDTR